MPLIVLMLVILLIHNGVLLVQYHVILLGRHLAFSVTLAFRHLFITLRGIFIDHQAYNTIVTTELRGRWILLLVDWRSGRALQHSWWLLYWCCFTIVLVLEKASDIIIWRIVGKIAFIIVVILTRR
jgi:hypothetical protein